ncbi:cytochrome P450 [Penicillium longicatenatum]|uniref:cytochrome P450 n=1 Tax=Penicillium longicatenatum TaxID=1561947 RepID=UPI00254901A5|nr:cytochrome P450 [Penicillium longicatenatum]KAJ5636491.1 cytochrome P450 [Penicillium longicatenatum]
MYSKRPLGGGKSFAIPALGEYQVLVSSEQDIRELTRSSEEVLSFHAAMHQRIRHEHTIYGFQHNDVDPNNDIPKRVLKVLLRTKLPEMQEGLQSLIQDTIAHELHDTGVDGWSEVSALGLAKLLIVRLNNHVILGSDLGNNEQLERDTSQYLQDAVVTMELCRHVPSILVPVIAPIMMRWTGAMHRVGKAVTLEIEKRVHENQNSIESKHIRNDCIQWVMESSKTAAQRTVSRMTQQMFGFLFASAHQMSMALVYAIIDLCLHPEYIELLRDEIEQAKTKTKFGPNFDQMPLLNGFLRESSRLNAMDALTIQRMALSSYTFAGGTHVPAGNLVAVPQVAVMQDSNHYYSPEEFNPYRFVDVDETDGSVRGFSKHTDVRWDYPYWGSMKRPCPGRWYASRTIKQILAHLVMEYELELVDEKSPRSFVWTTAVVPRSGVMLRIKKRQ